METFCFQNGHCHNGQCQKGTILTDLSIIQESTYQTCLLERAQPPPTCSLVVIEESEPMRVVQWSRDHQDQWCDNATHFLKDQDSERRFFCWVSHLVCPSATRSFFLFSFYGVQISSAPWPARGQYLNRSREIKTIHARSYQDII